MTLPPDARTTYDATDPVEDNPLAHKHALVRAVNRSRIYRRFRPTTA